MNKSYVYLLIVLSTILLVIIVIGAVRIKGLSDNVVKLSYSVIEKDSEIAQIENYITKNIELLDIEPDELIQAFEGLGIDTKNTGYVALFPSNGCGSCITMLCFVLEDLEIDKNAVYVITELENVTMRAELRGSGYNNYYLNKAIFDNIPDSENITFVSIKDGRCKMIKYDIQFPDYVKMLINQNRKV